MSEIVKCLGLGVCRDGKWLLRDLSLTIQAGEHWVVMGRNGAGKSTALKVICGQDRASVGGLSLFGMSTVGVDMRDLKARIGHVSSAVGDRIDRNTSALDVVMTGKYSALAPYWNSYTPADKERAQGLLESVSLNSHILDRMTTLSQGERQKVMLARAVMGHPEFLVLDEAMAGLDLGSREDLLESLGSIVSSEHGPKATVSVTHHVEEIPDFATHLLLLREGSTVCAGPLSTSLTQENLSLTFGRSIQLFRAGGRYVAFAHSEGHTSFLSEPSLS